MSANEIATVTQQYRNRIEAILTPDELACFDAYQQHVQCAIARRDSGPVALAPDEQAVLDKIAADTQAMALRTQLNVLLRIEIPPQ
jgi:hypothetical protein